ncbi:hypothetical protein [Kribbella sp. CCNWLY201]|uniref:hypothetical protein n=1 Tax=Kribbella sp. CCNWLY201 TaxID=3128544 RepID=UPI00301A8AE7
MDRSSTASSPGKPMDRPCGPRLPALQLSMSEVVCKGPALRSGRIAHECTGLRIGEALGLAEDAVDLETRAGSPPSTTRSACCSRG